MAICQVASVEIDAPREAVFAALTDYNSYARWMPEVTQSRILAQEGDIVEVEFVWPIYMPDRFSLCFIHTPPESVVYDQTDQFRQRGLSGRWDLTAAPKEAGTVLTGELKIKDGFFLDWRKRRRLRSVLRHSLAAISQQALVSRQELTTRDIPKTKVLEVVRRPDSLQVWLFGEKYRLDLDKGRGKS